MKRTLLLTAFSLFICTLGFSQAINHVDYGAEGLVIGINDNYAMDINNDDVIDFHINAWDDELGFSPIFAAGCFAAENYYETTEWGSKVLQIFQEGDVLEINSSNMYEYLDDDRGSTYQSDGSMAIGWENGVANYIGFAVFNPDGAVTNGWMKIKMDTDTEELIILEYAFHDFVATIGINNIVVGDRGLVAVQDLSAVLSDVLVSPNPAKNTFSIDYDYLGQENIQISILDHIGKEITSRSGNNQSNLVFDSSNWIDGIYFVNFRTDTGVHTERLMISN